MIDRLGVAYDRLAGAPAVEGGPVEEVFGASACVALYRRAMLDAIGGFDASFFAFGEDADVAWRARTAGWSCLYVPASVAYHHGSATAGRGVGAQVLPRRPQPDAAAGQERDGRPARALGLGDGALRPRLRRRSSPLTDRTLSPLRGRLAGLREWRAYRRAGAARRAARRRSPPRRGRSARGGSGRRTGQEPTGDRAARHLDSGRPARTRRPAGHDRATRHLPRAARRRDGRDGHPGHRARAGRRAARPRTCIRTPPGISARGRPRPAWWSPSRRGRSRRASCGGRARG